MIGDGRVMLDGSQYNDKGHAFRMASKHRNLLFGEVKEINFKI